MNTNPKITLDYEKVDCRKYTETWNLRKCKYYMENVVRIIELYIWIRVFNKI